MTEDGDAGDDAVGTDASTTQGGRAQVVGLSLGAVILFAALAVGLVAVARTNSDEDAAGAASGEAGTPGLSGAGAGAVDQLEISATDFAFDPTDPQIPADRDVAVILVNDGSIEHNWTVLEAGTTIASESDYDESMAVAAVGDAVGGESVEGSVSLPTGEYQVICTIAGHLDAGMTGTVAAGG